jgi:alpha-beta hydrolase superfamily lysophospholipase
MVARTLSRLAPRTGAYRVEASGISRDPDEVRRYEEDPLVYRGKLPARTLTEIADTVAAFPEQLPRLTLPLLAMHGTADRIVAIAGAELVAGRAGSSDSTLHRYEGFYHELFNEPAGERERPIGDLAGWLSARAA